MLFPSETQKSVSSRQPYNACVRLVNEVELRAMIESEPLCTNLFPANRIILDWIPFQLRVSNIKQMHGRNTQLFADVDCLDNLGSQSVKVPVGLLTVGTALGNIRPPFAYNLGIYGTDMTRLLDHVTVHMRCLTSSTEDLTSMLVFTETEVPVELVDKAFAEFGLTRTPWYMANVQTVNESKW
jgi:hypothetical protein